jgi:hypothetical protein
MNNYRQLALSYWKGRVVDAADCLERNKDTRFEAEYRNALAYARYQVVRLENKQFKPKGVKAMNTEEQELHRLLLDYSNEAIDSGVLTSAQVIGLLIYFNQGAPIMAGEKGKLYRRFEIACRDCSLDRAAVMGVVFEVQQSLSAGN